MDIPSSYDEIREFFPTLLEEIIERKNEAKSVTAKKDMKKYKFTYFEPCFMFERDYVGLINNSFLMKSSDGIEIEKILEKDFKNEFFQLDIWVKVCACFGRCPFVSSSRIELSKFNYDSCPNFMKKFVDSLWACHKENINENRGFFLDKKAALKAKEDYSMVFEDFVEAILERK